MMQTALYSLLFVGIVSGNERINLAAGKPAFANSSTTSDTSNAVDSNVGRCYQADDNDSEPWLMVDLQNFYEIETLVLSFKSREDQEAFHNVTIEIYDEYPKTPSSQHGRVCLYHENDFTQSTRYNMFCSSVYIGRYVLIRMSEMLENDTFLICEVEVYETLSVNRYPNVALNKLATSSSFNAYGPAWTLDGVMASHYGPSACFETRSGDSDPWLMVDLEDTYEVASIVVVSRNDQCCAESLRNFSVEVHSQPPGTPPSQPGSLCIDFQTVVAPAGVRVLLECTSVLKGRYVLVRPNDANEKLAICELEIYEDIPENRALRKPTSSRPRASCPVCAVDGSLSLTACFVATGSNPWWVVDLRAAYIVDHVVIATCCAGHLKNFSVEILSDQPADPAIETGALCHHHTDSIPPARLVTLPCENKHEGRYVLLRSSLTKDIDPPFTLCEVQVYGHRQECHLCINFQRTTRGRQLGDPLQVLTVPTAAECAAKCFVTKTCNSFNYSDSQTSNCQLFANATEDTADDSNWSYYKIVSC